MKHILTLLGALFIIINLSGQAPPRDPETTAKERTKKMKELIQFSDEQETKVYDLNLDLAKKRQTAFENRTGDREEMRATMKNIQDEYETELKKVLDEKQYIKYLEEKDNLRSGNRQQRPGGQVRGGERKGRG